MHEHCNSIISCLVLKYSSAFNSTKEKRKEGEMPKWSIPQYGKYHTDLKCCKLASSTVHVSGNLSFIYLAGLMQCIIVR